GDYAAAGAAPGQLSPARVVFPGTRNSPALCRRGVPQRASPGPWHHCHALGDELPDEGTELLRRRSGNSRGNERVYFLPGPRCGAGTQPYRRCKEAFVYIAIKRALAQPATSTRRLGRIEYEFIQADHRDCSNYVPWTFQGPWGSNLGGSRGKPNELDS